MISDTSSNDGKPNFSLNFSTERGFVIAVNALLDVNFCDGQSAMQFLNARKPGCVFGPMVAVQGASGTAAVDQVSLKLNSLDDVGNVVGSATSNLSVEHLSSIVDNASQLIAVRRDGQTLDNMLDALDTALTAADLVESARQPAAQEGR